MGMGTRPCVELQALSGSNHSALQLGLAKDALMKTKDALPQERAEFESGADMC